MRKSKNVPPASTVGPDAAAKKQSVPCVGEIRVHCRRVDSMFTLAEHRDCPYCFGATHDVATGEHAKFCDFKPGQDPVIFGFPDDQGRYSWK